MTKMIKVFTLGAILATTSLLAKEETTSNKITIEEMEVNLAKLGAEIAQDKVKLYQREALLFEMKLDLLRRLKEAK
jgi:inorganic pyrophosphatase/exopolyphosphatase